jgi:hypothetical protein
MITTNELLLLKTFELFFNRFKNVPGEKNDVLNEY